MLPRVVQIFVLRSSSLSPRPCSTAANSLNAGNRAGLGANYFDQIRQMGEPRSPGRALMARLPGSQIRMVAGWAEVLYAEQGWLRGLDLNQRPPGYEPDELPGCSTPQKHHNT